MEWISVKDRLPERLDVVIVQGGIAYYLPDEEAWMTITGERWPGRPIVWNVTHWMPLPEPPEES